MAEPQVITEEDGVHEEWYEEAKSMTLATLPEFLRKLTEDYDHGYGTICHAVAAAAFAAAMAVDRSPQGGITGFQAGCIMWMFVRRWLSLDCPCRLIQYDRMLYPQEEESFAKTISGDTWEWLQKTAMEKLAEKDLDHVSPKVREHWESIVGGQVPFGYEIEGNE